MKELVKCLELRGKRNTFGASHMESKMFRANRNRRNFEGRDLGA